VGASGLGGALWPVVVLGVLAGLLLFMRWAFGTGYGRDTPAPQDDGLLVPIATLSGRESARALRAVLSDAGIRSTIRSPDPRRADVLVFPEDADRARALAAGFTGPRE
jgi:hypothetical protein